jgi:poly-gamma-glutamate synthesis protein (capsule biosynthesis protein)
MFRLTAVGDVSLGDQPVRYGHGVRSIIDKYGIEFIFERVYKYLDGQIVFGNLEYVLSDIGYDESVLAKGEFRGRPEYAAGLRDAGFTTLSLANNHSMQFGVAAFKDTVAHLKACNINPIGVSINNFSNSQPIQIKHARFEIIAYSFRPENYFAGKPLYANSFENLLSQVESIRNNGAVAIVSLHWGEEFLHTPSPRQREVARSIIDRGASLIIGHHPHVLQGIEQYKSGYIVYSLGNFVADFWQPYARNSTILKCELSENGVQSINMIPIIINELYQPEIANDEKKQDIARKIEEYSAAIDNVSPSSDTYADDEYNKYASKIYRRFRIKSYLYFIKNIYRYKFNIIIQSILRSLERRIQK